MLIRYLVRIVQSVFWCHFVPKHLMYSYAQHPVLVELQYFRVRKKVTVTGAVPVRMELVL